MILKQGALVLCNILDMVIECRGLLCMLPFNIIFGVGAALKSSESNDCMSSRHISI